MEELIKYFESLEARLAASETHIAQLEAEVAELKNRPLPEPQVIEKIVEKIVEVEKPVVVTAPAVEEEPVVEAIPVEEKPQPVEPAQEEPVVAPEPEEQASPKAAIYGKAVDDIRQAISLGDRFLYQRELFGQNGELMQKTLTELNALHSYEEALSYIAQFNWDTESSTYQQFLVTLHRRFG